MGSLRCPKVAISLILLFLIMAPNIRQIAGLAISSQTFESGRHLLQSDNATKESARKSDDTVRVDPFDHLKKYRGGYDITNMHYWSSTIFTGIHGYALAALWLLCGVAYGGYALVTTFWFKNSSKKPKKRSPCHMQCYLWSIFVAIFFTILAVTACGIVLGGNAKFHTKAKRVVDIIIDTADDASDTIYNTTGAMKDMGISLAASNENDEASNFLSSTSEKLDTEAAGIQRQARKNRRLIDKGLKILYIITTVTISLNLIAVIALSVFGILKQWRIFHLLIVICWILTVFCWLFFGIYFFVSNFAGDTCTALEDFQRDPYNNSLSSLLPCDQLLSAKPLLRDVSSGVYKLVNEVNRNISRNYGSSFKICNPFSAPPEYAYHPEDCPANTIHIGDISELLKLVACPDSNPTCIGGIPISARDYDMLGTYTTSIQRLLNAYPGMESLVECQTVTDAFSEILNKQCKPLKRYARMVWSGMLFLSVVMVALVLIWTTEAQHQQYHHSSDGSVKPYSAATDMESEGKVKETNDDF